LKITTYGELTPEQERVIGSFQDVVVRAAPSKPCVVATFTTLFGQVVKVTIAADGGIESVSWEELTL